MFEVASAAVEGALAAGARYADARGMILRQESMAARNGDVEDLVQRESVGVGVRALVGSSWGFVAVPDPTDEEARRAGAEATAVARASALVPGPDLALVPVEARQDSWASPCAEDPLSVPLAEKGDLVAGVTAVMRDARGVGRPRRPTTSGTPPSGSSPARATGSSSGSGSAARR